MTEVVFILETPTPHRTPTLDSLFKEGIGLTAMYHNQSDSKRGWGDVTLFHPSEIIPKGILRGTLLILRTILTGKTRILCCFGYDHISNIVAILAARILGIQIVTRSDSNWFAESARPRWRRLIKRLILRTIYGSRTRVWTIGSQNERYWQRMGLPSRILIPFDVPVPPTANPASRDKYRTTLNLGPGPTFVSVSMLEEWKGIRTLITAFGALQDTSAKLIVVGKGSLESLVQEAAERDPRIIYQGPLTHQELGKIYVAADVLVLASLVEPWGLVVNEAQANGLRVICSHAVGAAEDRIDSSNGWTFEAGNADHLTQVLGSACELLHSGVKRLTCVTPVDPAAQMLDELISLGATRSVKHAGDSIDVRRV